MGSHVAQPLVVATAGGVSQLLFTTTIVAAFFAGVVALFAPCCVSVMLPAYLATGVHRRRGLVAMTFLFAAGVGAVILPIAFGATVLSRVINGQHTIVYSTMAVVMVAMGLAMTAGIRIPIPMLGLGARDDRGGPVSVFVLGAFSGVATACCAPVLAGVVALSGATGSFVTALVVGVAYVFGMVAPLFVVALVWDGRDLGATRWLAARTIRLRLGPWARTMSLSNFAGGLLLVGMGVVVGVLAITGPNMATRGWQATLSDDAQHAVHVVTTWLAHLPGWMSAFGVFAALACLVVVAVRQAAGRDEVSGESIAKNDSAAEAPETDDLGGLVSGRVTDGLDPIQRQLQSASESAGRKGH